ncbi:hypothetical protein ONZ45_g10997 [Pleurotus djamor]|nr:hypothetical protein ONZ45_g10997 [Pleurotus djamor]
MMKFDPINDIPDLSGKVALVTGGNRGMGYHIVQQLANHGAKVYMAARSEGSANEAIGQLEAESPSIKQDSRVVFLRLDLSTLKSAQDSANRFLSLEGKLDILVHNAGIMSHPYGQTSDGIEDSMAINHFAPFVFTKVLYPLLLTSAQKPASDVRVIIVSSEIHPRAPVGGKFASQDEVNDPLAPPASQDKLIACYARYARSKLANILYAKQLQDEFTSASSSALAISVNPGGVATETVLEDMASFRFVGPLLKFLVSKLAKSPLDGALSALHAATSPEVRRDATKFGGGYIASVGRLSPPSKDGQSAELAKQLWEVSEKISRDVLNGHQ